MSATRDDDLADLLALLKNPRGQGSPTVITTTIVEQRCVICGHTFLSVSGQHEGLPTPGDLVLDEPLWGLCSNCQERYDNGLVALVGFTPNPDKEHADEHFYHPSEIHRTGLIAWLTVENAEKLLEKPLPRDEEGKVSPMVLIEDAQLRELRELDALMKATQGGTVQ